MNKNTIKFKEIQKKKKKRKKKKERKKKEKKGVSVWYMESYE